MTILQVRAGNGANAPGRTTRATKRKDVQWNQKPSFGLRCQTHQGNLHLTILQASARNGLYYTILQASAERGFKLETRQPVQRNTKTCNEMKTSRFGPRCPAAPVTRTLPFRKQARGTVCTLPFCKPARGTVCTLPFCKQVRGAVCTLPFGEVTASTVSNAKTRIVQVKAFL